MIAAPPSLQNSNCPSILPRSSWSLTTSGGMVQLPLPRKHLTEAPPLPLPLPRLRPRQSTMIGTRKSSVRNIASTPPRTTGGKPPKRSRRIRVSGAKGQHQQRRRETAARPRPPTSSGGGRPPKRAPDRVPGARVPRPRDWSRGGKNEEADEELQWPTRGGCRQRTTAGPGLLEGKDRQAGGYRGHSFCLPCRNRT